jgi:hypothetical protein
MDSNGFFATPGEPFKQAPNPEAFRSMLERTDSSAA